MKKISTLFIVLLCCAYVASAQDVFRKNDIVVNAGIGIGTYFGGSGYSTICPPIAGSFEIGVADRLIDGMASIGVGGYLGYTAEQFKHTDIIKSVWNYVIIGARGNFHYQFVDDLDTYAGLMLGYNVESHKFKGGNGNDTFNMSSSYGGFLFGIHIGARYYFSDRFGVFAELGYGVSPLQLGVSFKF